VRVWWPWSVVAGQCLGITLAVAGVIVTVIDVLFDRVQSIASGWRSVVTCMTCLSFAYIPVAVIAQVLFQHSYEPSYVHVRQDIADVRGPWLVCVLGFALVGGAAAGVARAATPRSGISANGGLRSFVSCTGAMVARGLLLGTALGSGLGLLFSTWPAETGSSWSGWSTGAEVGAFVGIALGALTGVVRWIRARDLATRTDPLETGRGDRCLAVIVGPAIGTLPFVTGCLIFGVRFEPPPSPALRIAMEMAAMSQTYFVVLSLVGAGAFMTATASFPVAVARCWLTATGALPWRLTRFLADAHTLGILRQVGAVYQFRHARLRRRLAES